MHFTILYEVMHIPVVRVLLFAELEVIELVELSKQLSGGGRGGGEGLGEHL